MSVGFRPTEADDRIIQAHKRSGESTSDVMRRALRALEREEWQAQARRDMERIAAGGEDLSEEPDEWGYDDEGKVVDLRYAARSAATPAAPESPPATSGQVPPGLHASDSFRAVAQMAAKGMAPLRHQTAALAAAATDWSALAAAGRSASLRGALAARCNLAISYQQAGRTDQAIRLLQRVVADDERLLGNDHPDTLIALTSLAASYEVAGRTGEANELLERVVAGNERLLEDEHSGTSAPVVPGQVGDTDLVTHGSASGLQSLTAAAEDAARQSVESLFLGWDQVGLTKGMAHVALNPSNGLLSPQRSSDGLINMNSRLAHAANHLPTRHWKMKHLRTLAARRAGRR